MVVPRRLEQADAGGNRAAGRPDAHPRPGEDRRLSDLSPAFRLEITGLVLAGGRGSRMGGIDKGLALCEGVPLATTALQRLGSQVGRLAISANRNLPAYAALGVPVWPDSLPDLPGPLAGILTGLERCDTAFLATVPCDAPGFPADLVQRLANALTAANADLAVATVDDRGVRHRQPVFCLVRKTLAADLTRFLASGQRRVGAWFEEHRVAEAVFDDSAAFVNLNTAAALLRA